MRNLKKTRSNFFWATSIVDFLDKVNFWKIGREKSGLVLAWRLDKKIIKKMKNFWYFILLLHKEIKIIL